MPDQALVEERFADVGQSGEPAPVFKAEFGLHLPIISDSLQGRLPPDSEFPANRYVKMFPASDSELLEPGLMETAGERRRRKLKVLCDSLGVADVAKAAGKNPVYLEQIIKGRKLPPKADGTRSARNLGDATARAIEAAFDLGEGWFDAPDEPGALSHDAMTVAKFYERAPPEVKQMMVRMVVPVDIDLNVGDSSHMGGMDTGLGLFDQIPPTKDKKGSK